MRVWVKSSRVGAGSLHHSCTPTIKTNSEHRLFFALPDYSAVKIFHLKQNLDLPLAWQIVHIIQILWLIIKFWLTKIWLNYVSVCSGWKHIYNPGMEGASGQEMVTGFFETIWNGKVKWLKIQYHLKTLWPSYLLASS